MFRALVVASRFGMLLGLALWLGLAASLLLSLPAIARHLPEGQSRELTAALVGRFDRLLVLAVALVLVGLGARILIDRAAPPTSLILPVAAMTLVRVVSAFTRKAAVRTQLQSLEVCLGLYALWAIS